MKAEDLKGRPVVSISEGVRVGVVEDLQFNPVSLRIDALSVGGSRERRRLYFQDIQNIGPDAITVRSLDAVKPIGDTNDLAIGALLTLSELFSRKVVDETGTALGGIDSVGIDPLTGGITHITAGQGGIAGIGRSSVTIDAVGIVSIGDVIVVRSANGEAPAS